MKSNLKLGAAILLSAGLFSCNNANNVTPEVQDGNTFSTLKVSTNFRSSARAISDSQADWQGRAKEGIAEGSTLKLLSSAGDHSWSYADALAAGKFAPVAGNDGVFGVEPWKTKAGNQTIAIGFNLPEEAASIGMAADQVYDTKGKEKEAIDLFAATGKFVMSSATEQKTINEGVSEADAKAATDETKNKFSFDVERVVSQGVVVKKADLKAETTDGIGSVNLDNLTYTAVNGAVKTYLFRNHAGERTLTEADGQYKDFKSAIDDYTDFEAAKDPTAVAGNLIRLGNINIDKSAETPSNYAAVNVFENEKASKADDARGIYFFENSVDKNAMTTENKDYGFYRLAYAKVYTTFTPKTVLKLDDNDNLAVDKDFQAGTTFYKGEADGVFYASVEAAHKAVPGQKVYTYTDGKCAYRALWNRQVDGDKVVNADARRNNTYILSIASFAGIGMPWDPSDPGDPYLPKPDTPDEGKTPEDPDIEKQDTYMNVEAKVLQWNVVSREVVLD